jgi:hypothetical protein
MELWPDAMEITRNSRFRDTGNLTPEFLYTHYLALTGRASVVPWWATLREASYMPLENSLLLARALIGLARWQRPNFLTLNDNFGDRPNPRVVQVVRAFLDGYWPVPSSFERKASA